MKVARGANRTVLLVGRYALKFPTFNSWRDFLFGLLNNQTEARVGGSGRPGACPVLWADRWGFVVVMPRVGTFTRAGWVTFDSRAWVKSYALCVEEKPCSFGLYDGEVVAIDYGWNN